MYKKNVLKSKYGFSLIEVMLALSILGIVLAVGYSFFFFGSNSFRIGGAQSNLQRDMRLVSDYITREVRYAVDIEITNDTAVLNEGDYHYIYLDSSSSTIKYIDPAGNVTLRTDPVIDNVTFSFATVSVSDTKENYLLVFSIEGSSSVNNNIYVLESDVMLNNISAEPGNNVGSILRYKKP